MRIVKDLGPVLTAMLFLVSAAVYAAPAVQTTGELSLRDAAWEPIGLSYPPESDSAYFELSDEDANKHPLDFDSVAVTVRSEMGDVETLYLRETAVSSSVFRRSIALELQSPRFVRYLKEAYPKGLPQGEEGQAVYQAELSLWNKRAKTEAAAIGDGNLQIAAGNDLSAEYLDPVNDWGEEELIAVSAVYGGWEGYVSGTWTVDNSPYVLVGDVRIGEGYSLTIEAGVRVLLLPDVSLFVRDGATLRVLGTSSDSVYFDSKSASPADSEFWGGIGNEGYSYGSPLTMTISYAAIRHSLTGIQFGANSGNLLMSHCRISESGDANDYYSDRVLTVSTSGNCEISECAISNNFVSGIQLSAANGILRGGEVSANAENGVIIQGSGVRIEQVTIADNGGLGVAVNIYSSEQTVSIHECSIYGNGNYDILNNGNQDVDARFNWWGDLTTAEINNGPNPKNISRFYDKFDNSYQGQVRYGGCVGCAESGSTGEVTLTDAFWSEVDISYPPGSDTAYIEVRDADLNSNADLVDEAEVEVSSEVGDDETVYLEETGTNSGVFRGRIAFDLQVERIARVIRSKYPDGFRSEEEYQEILRREISAKSQSTAIQALADGDGLLQVSAGGWLKVEYKDALNEWGSAQSPTSQAIYGGWAGYIGGIWTASGNPYIVVGDIIVGNGYSLTISAGVVVKFMPDVTLYIQEGASLRVLGSAGDSVFFGAMSQPAADSQYWNGVQLGGYSSSPTTILEASYLVITNAIAGIVKNGGQAMMKMSHCRVSGCGDPYYYYGGNGVYVSGACEISNCVLTNNRGHGLSLSSATGRVIGGEASYNMNNGIQVQSSQITIEQTKVLYNQNSGIDVSGYNPDYMPAIHHCQLFGNGRWDLSNSSQYDVDVKYNWWGEATTLEMKTGPNPKNISMIYDYFDYSYMGVAKYGGWMKFPYVVGDVNGNFSVNITDVVGLMHYLFAHGAAPIPVGAGDSNCDGRINLTDVVYIVNFIFGGGPEPGAACP